MSKITLVDFWAGWCGPCKLMHPIVEEIENEYNGKLTVTKFDVDDPNNQAAIQKYQVMAMPSFFIEKNGEVIEQFVGAQSKKTLVDAIEKALS